MSNKEKYYVTVMSIENLSPVDYMARANELIDLAESPTQDMKDTYYPSFVSLLDRWITSGENKARDKATADEDKAKLNTFVDDLKEAKDNYIGLVGKTSKNTAENNVRPEVLRKNKDAPEKPDGTPEGDTIKVEKKPAQPQTRTRATEEEKAKMKNDLNNLSGQTSRTQKVRNAIEEGLSMPDNIPVEKFIREANLAELNKELEQIKEALALIDIAQRDLNTVKPDLRGDLSNQMKRLEDLQRTIMRSNRYRDLANRGDTQPVRDEGIDLPPLPPKQGKPEQVEPERPPTPTGTVRDENPGFNENNPLVLEAREYIRKIKAVPSGQVPIQVNEILKVLQDALDAKDLNRLQDGLDRARSYFRTVDANLNRVVDSKEIQGRAIEQGLDDFKKIEKEKKDMKNNKPKLEDLRATAEEGEEERVKKNFNKDILELTKANDILNSQVNLQKEEIKVLKETIEQKLKKENEAMMAGVAPVFRQYLQLDIDNVYRDDELEDEVYYSVL